MSLFQIFLVDNIINGLNFTINYFLTTNKKIIVNKYVNLYELNILERYSIYFLIYLFKCFLEEFDIYLNDYILLIITIPFLQNSIKYLKCYSSYINIKKTFIKYTISKYSIQFLLDLHQDIIKIPNIKMNNNDEGGNLHDTEKPVALMKILIENSTFEGDLVFEPFAGIGSTILACIKSKRKYIGVEIDKNYYETIKFRTSNDFKPTSKGTLFE